MQPQSGELDGRVVVRLGEICIAAGLLNTEQLGEAVTRQSRSTGRMGTQLVQLGFLTADQVALALGKQHQVPPVLVRHFVHHDPAVVKLISSKIAAEHFILPIAFSRKGGTRSLVLCLRDPRNAQLISRLQQELKLPIIASVASELAIRVYLEHYYHVDAVAKVGRPASHEDDVDIDISDFGEQESGLDTLDLVDLDHHEVNKGAPESFVPEARRSSGISAALRAAAPIAKAQAEHRAATLEEPSAGSAAPKERVPLEKLIASIEAADKRAAIGDSIIDFFKQRFAAGLMFTVKDGLAMGHRGFGGHLDDEDTVAALMLPLANSIFGAAHDSLTLWRGDPKALSTTAQDRFFTLFAMGHAPGEVVVAPVAIGKKVVCLLYAHAENGSQIPDAAVDELAAIAAATDTAFARIIRSARKTP